MKLKSKNSKLPKKLLSILISVLMIVSSMPFAVVTASAASAASAADNDNAEITVMHYTFDNTLADSNGNNELQIVGWANDRVSVGDWEYTNGAFRHGDGGCFGTISGLKGLKQWKLTYQGYSAVDIDGSKMDKSCEIGLGTTETTTDAIRISNYGQIFINGVPKNNRGSLLSSTTNTIVIAYDNGSLSVSINGNTTNYDGDDGVESTIFENIVSMHSGVNSKTDGDSVGRVGSYDHYIYDIVATTYVDSYTLLTEKMKEFENKLQSGTIYTNISNAYTAYVEASKAYDSYYYGGDTSIQLATYAENLNEAVNSMQEWTFDRKYANNNKGIWMINNNNNNPMTFNDSYTPSSTSTGLGETKTYNSHQNILYAGIANKDFASLSRDSMEGWLRYQPITMMYDGETLPQAPIMVVYGSNSKAPRYTLAITLSDNDNNSLKLVNRWLFSRDNSYAENFDWHNAYLQNGGGDYCISQSLPGWQVQLGKGGCSGWTTKPGMANLYNFDGSFSNNEYLKEITPTINFHTTDVEGSTNITIPQNFTASGDESDPVKDYRIHVINYKAVIDAAEVYKNNVNITFDVTKYREGGLKTRINKIDDVGNLLNFNPNDYFNSATSSSNAGKNDYQGCANKISEICTSVNNVNNPKITEDNQLQYPALRKAMDETMATYKAGMGNYTYRSYNQFKTKYEFAQRVMQNVKTFDGYVDGSFAQTAAVDLTTAYNNLETQKSNITFENLFSFEDFYNSNSAGKGSLTSASFDRANKTMTLVGTNDVSTVHDGENLYMIPVEPGKTYRLELDVEASDNYSLHNCDVMAFLLNEEGTSYDTDYVNNVNWRGYTSSTWRNYNTHKSIEFTIPADYLIERSKIFFRFGTMRENDNDVQQVTVTYKNIVFYDVEREAERGNLTDLGVTEISVTPGQKYGDLPSPTREGYVFDGWYTDKEFRNQVTSDSIAVAGQTAVNLYAKWHAHNFENQITMSKNGNIYTWTGKCTCGEIQELSKVDASAYVSAVEAARTDIANTVKYSSVSIARLQNILNNNTLTFANEPVLYQADVETATNNIIYADQIKTENNKGVLELATYTVTFNTVNGENLKEEEVSKEPYEYGSVVSLKAKNVAPYKWMIGDRKVATATNEFSLVVTGDVTVNAHYLSQTPSVVTGQHLVTVYNRQRKVVGFFYVDDNAKLTVDGSTIKWGEKEVTPDKPPFYQITGYTVEGGADANGYIVTSDIKVYANYSAQTEITITLDKSNANIYFENDKTKSETEKKVVWDQKITVKSESDVIWLVKGKAVAKGTSYTFRASDSITISTQGIATETPSSVITYAAFDTDNNKARLAVSNYSSDKYKIKEQGIIFGTTSNMSATFTSEELALKGKKYVATKTTDTGDQFSYTLTFTSTTPKKLCVISYVVYDDGTTVYSDNVTYVGINCEIN